MHEATQHVLNQFDWNTAAIRERTLVLCDPTSERFRIVALGIADCIDGPDATALLRDLLSVRNNVIMRMAQDV